MWHILPRTATAGIVITSTYLNPALRIITWVLLSFISLVLGFRLLTKFALKSSRTLLAEEVLMILAYVRTSIAQYFRGYPR